MLATSAPVCKAISILFSSGLSSSRLSCARFRPFGLLHTSVFNPGGGCHLPDAELVWHAVAWHGAVQEHAMRREMFESEAKNGHRGVFELLHLSDKASGAGVASLSPREFPLYYGGKELKPFQYALFLLSKVRMALIPQSPPCFGGLFAGTQDCCPEAFRSLGFGSHQKSC